jgi:amidase
MRRWSVPLLIAVAAATVAAPALNSQVSRPQLIGFDVVEASISDMQRAMDTGRVTSKELVLQSLARIAIYKDLLNPVIALNGHAVDEAEILDIERAQGRVRGPLHGIPIAVKDNILTTNMPTSGGALAFKGFAPPYEATIVTNLRRAGAVIIAKTVMTELANFVTNGMPGNYSAVGGWGMNPYDPRPDPRTGLDGFGIPFNDGRPVMNTGGSSSGIGTAASLWAASVGTETSGSILSPSNQNMLVGIKPTVGRNSRWGIIPITADQDTAGPMARNVTDAAIMLGAMEGVDPKDPATTTCVRPPGSDYTRFLRLTGLRGARIGIPRANYYDPITPPGATNPTGGRTPEQLAIATQVIQVLKEQGAVIVDPANIPSIVDLTPANNLLLFGGCGTAAQTNCSTVLFYGMKRDFNAILATFGATSPVHNLTELRAYNVANAPRNAIRYRQDLLDESDKIDLARDLARYQADRAKDVYLSATHGIGEAMAVNQLDALLFFSNTAANIAARPGYPSITVPYGFISNANAAFPAGFNPKNQPWNATFTSTACNEPRLIEIAYAFEQATKKRVPPTLP